MAYDFLETTTRAHGRRATCRYLISEEVDWLTHRPAWENPRSVGIGESVRDIAGKLTMERRFFIASIDANAETFALALRGHWEIENTLHWSLDVSFTEDQCRVRSGTPLKSSLSSDIRASISSKAKIPRSEASKVKQKNAGWDHSYLLKLLRF